MKLHIHAKNRRKVAKREGPATTEKPVTKSAFEGGF